VNDLRTKLVLVLLVFSISYLSQVYGQSCEPVYQLQTETGAFYGLAGVAGQFTNGSSVTVQGLFDPYNASASQPSPNFMGTIYVQTLQTGTVTYSHYSITVVQVSGNISQTVTQPSPYPSGLKAITVSGTLTYNYACPQPVSEVTKPAFAAITALTLLALLIGLLFVHRGKRANLGRI
jgi:hypothetical protein